MKDYSNYHNLNFKDKITHDGLLLLENSLNGFEGYDVTINDKQTKILIYQKYDSSSEVKKIIGHTQDIERGNLISINNEKWLVVTYPEDNKIYRKAEIKLCNSTFPIQTNKTLVQKKDQNGNPVFDRFGDPVFIEVGGEIIKEPCIVETTFLSTNQNGQFLLPEGRIHIIMKYQKADCLKINYEFNMYNYRYKIYDIDYTKVIDGVGLLTIIANKVVKE